MRWWTALRAGPARIRLRRKIYLFSLPVIVVALLVVGKLITTLWAGGSAVGDFERHDIAALRNDISLLSFLNVVEPAKLPFLEGDLQVLEGRLVDADASFERSLRGTAADRSCPVRINLVLVRETLGDLASRAADREAAKNRYRAALAVVNDAPAGCFADNDDANDERRKIRHESKPRLEAKIDSLERPPTSSTPTPSPSAGPAPSSAPEPAETDESGQPPPSGPSLPEMGEAPTSTPAPPTTAPAPNPNAPQPDDGGGEAMNDVDADRLPSTGYGADRTPGHRLEPGSGDPLERLREALGDANASGSNSE